MEFSKRLDDFGDEIFAALNDKKIALEEEGRTLYNLSVGTPDFETPKYIREALIESAKDPDSWKYALRDLPELIDAVIEYYEKRFHVTLTPDMITTCYGTQDGCGHLGMVLLNEGDTVLLPTPCYPVFIASAIAAGANISYYPMLKENDFLPDVSLIDEETARKAKYMIVSLPSNPMGSVGNDQIYEELISFCQKNDILLVHDNAYSDIIFDGKIGGSFLHYDHAKEIGVEFFSLSKSFNVTGARISFLIGRPDVIKAYKKFRTQIDFGMFIPIQKAAIAALRGPLDNVKSQCDEYELRRNTLCDGLTEIGWTVPYSKGSMFVFAKIPEKYQTSMEFCMDLIEKAGVICTPGSSFGPLGEGYVRFALVLPEEKLKEAVKAIQDSGIFD